jgi:hypothetical protein
VIILAVVFLATGYFLMAKKNSELQQGSQRKVVLIKGQPQLLPDGKTKLTLMAAKKALANCRDCLTMAEVEVEQAGKKEKIVFKVGGFAGHITNEQIAFNIDFKIETVEDNQTTLLYTVK